LLSDKFKARFAELETQMPRSEAPMAGNSAPFYDPDHYIGWATSAQDLIRAVFGQNSPQYENFVFSLKASTVSYVKLESLKVIFNSAKEAFDDGYIFNVELTVSGELFGNFVEMAKHALSEGHKDVAAVLACAALEDTLKRYALINGLTIDGNSMQDTVNALKSKGLVTGAQKTLLESMPKIRDYAMHANWDKIDAPAVNSVIGYVEQFLLSKFSGS
jgi:hypothetical protein